MAATAATVTARSGEDPIEATGRFQPEARNVAAARRFIVSSLADWDRVPELEDVVLLASEVVTNVVIHAGPHGPGDEIIVGVHRTDDLVRVEVTDRHPGFPVVGTGSLARASGRGLLLLDLLATAWGVVPNGTGKVGVVRGASLTLRRRR